MCTTQELTFPYGLNLHEVRVLQGGDAALVNDTSTGLLTLSTGTIPGSLAGIQGKYPIYFNSANIDFRFTGKFEADPQDDTLTVIGLGDNESGVLIGYNGTQFGLGINFGGSMQYYWLAFASPAVASGNVTVTLNGVDYNVAVTAGDTIGAIQAKFAASTALAAGAHFVYPADSGVYILTVDAYPSTAPPAFDGHLTGVTGAVSLTVEGATPNTTWVYGPDWNGPQLSRMSPISWSEGNTFAIHITPLGFGTIEVYVMDPVSSVMFLLHAFSRRNTSDSFNLTAGLWPAVYARNLGSPTSTSISTTGFNTRATSYIKTLLDRPACGVSCAQWNVTATSQNTNVITLFSQLVLNNTRNRKIVLFKSIFISANSTAPCTLSLISNATFSQPTNSSRINADSCVYADRNPAVKVSGGEVIRTWHLTDSPAAFVFDMEFFCLTPCSTLSLVCRAATPQNAAVNVSTELLLVER